jgi:Zn-dependent alcohol dehydrogenase
MALQDFLFLPTHAYWAMKVGYMYSLLRQGLIILGAGYVRAVGSKVTKAKPGDAVLLSFAFCTQCHNCKFGAPGYCHEFTALNFSGSGEAFQISKPAFQKVGGSFFGQSSFAKLTRVQETSLVNVTELITHPEDLKLFAPLGCGIQVSSLEDEMR